MGKCSRNRTSLYPHRKGVKTLSNGDSGLKYFLIVSPDKEEVEVYTNEGGTYQLKQTGRDFTYTFSFKGDCTETINFKEIW